MAQAPRHRALFLIADGMGDRPIQELGNKTPLEAAMTPHLDRLAREGECGLMDPVSPGIRVGSDTGHLALLGYDSYQVYTGRGPFEALGIGMEVRGGDIALRCNFSTVDENGIVTDRRAGRIEHGTAELAEALQNIEIEGVKCFFKESVAHRGALVLRGENLSPHISDADPHSEGVKVLESKPIDPGDTAAARTARIVNLFTRESYNRLNNHPVNRARREQGLNPANIILARGAGVAPHLKPFNQLHHTRAAAIVETGLIRGIARFIGMEVIDSPGATGGIESDLTSMGKTIVDALQKYDFVLCNVKGPDLCGHDNLPFQKAQCIERIDAMVGMILQQAGKELYILVTADHSTPCSVGDHSGDPVPLLIWGPDLRGDDTTAYHERSCAKGALGRLRGSDLVPILTQLMNLQEKFGA